MALIALMVTSCVSRREERVREIPVEKSDMTEDAWRWADSVIAGMDTVRLVEQLMMPAIYSTDDLWTLRTASDYGERGIGGVVLLKGDSEGARRLAEVLDSASLIPPFVAIDAEWGLKMRLVDAPEFPANGRISAKAGDQLMYEYGREVARECRRLGINMILGPVLDVNKGDSFLGVRSFGSDPVRVGELGVSYGRGLEDGNVISVAKHFPGHGSVRVDSHRTKGVIGESLQRLDSIDLKPFRMWIESGLTGVMVGHLAVPAIDSRLYPAAVSSTVIGDLLKDDMGFRGLVLTDAMNMGGAEGYGADMAIAAGADIIVAPADTERERDRIMDAVRRGTLQLDAIKQRVRRILFHKYLIGLSSQAPRSRVGNDDVAPCDADTLSSMLAGTN